ncbi:MAG TPA: hypothetical protein VN231_10765 [Allosphingosinicella sp.]|nr:hypothetical protein [Allosphingosinicella sp.]
MNERPVSVTIVGWFLIVAGSAALLALWTGVPGAREAAQAFAAAFEGEWMLIASLAVAVGCGAGILAGINWARFLYIGWNLAGIGEGLLLISPMRFSAPAAIMFAAIAVVLIRADGWFHRDEDKAGIFA